MRALACMAAIAVAALAIAPVLGQGRGGPSAAPSAPPAATGTHVFYAPAGSPLTPRNGRPLWEVYNDCAWANYNAYIKLLDEEKQREANEKAAAANSGAAPGSLASMAIGVDPATRNARMAESSQKRQKLTQRSDALTARAVTAYAALTGKSEAEVKAHVSNFPAAAALTVEACAGLVP